MLVERRIPGFLQGLPKTQVALRFARRAHSGQRRVADGAPFIEHPLEVASLLYYAGAPDDLVAAGLLHDILEHTATNEAELGRQFGPRVARLVLAVTEDRTINDYAARKAALRAQVARAGDEALLLFAADKISKVRELHTRSASSTRAITVPSAARRLRHYRESLRMLEVRISDSPLLARLRVELDALGDRDHVATAAG